MFHRTRLSVLTAVAALALPGHAVNTVHFDPNDAGIDKSVPTWGVDSAWANFDNVRQSFHHIGQDNVEIVRVLVYYDEPLVNLGGGNYELNAAAKAKVDNHLALAAMGGPDIPLTFGTGGTFPGEVDPSYLQGGGVNVTQYARVIKATQEYINTQPGFTNSPIYAIEPFNEPDFNVPYNNPADLNSVITQLKTYPEFANTLMVAPSVLNSDLAQGWYDAVPQATAGSSHLLAGSLTSYTNFITHVNNTGKPFVAPELHSMGEILASADRGTEAGMVWADVLRGRGTLIRASDGDRLAYAENLGSQSAAAVYRAPDGRLYAFAGGVERDYLGSDDTYRFVSSQDAWFNGIKVREYMMHTKHDNVVDGNDNDYQNYGSWSNEGSFAEVSLDGSGVPALDGYRWKIVNQATGESLEVAGGGTGDGADIRTAASTDGLNQKWNIIRTRNGYYQLYNANSGRTAEVAFASLNNGANVRQWGTADNQTQQWYIEDAGDGTFHLLNGHSNMLLTGSPGSSTQSNATGSNLQKWSFVLDQPDAATRRTTEIDFQGDFADNAHIDLVTTFGNPGFGQGPAGFGQAVNLDGNDDYLQLRADIANSADLTVATWVKWDGGGAWQRIFDFGDNTDQNMFLTPSSGDGTMRFAITQEGNDHEYILDTDPLPVGQWVHLAVTVGGNTGILYVDGVPRVAGEILINPDDFNPTLNYIGKSQYDDPLFDGMIDDFRVFDFALDADQIADLMDVGLAGDFNDSGLVEQGDLDVVLQNWGSSASQFAGWVNQLPDGLVDQNELDAVLLNWGGSSGGGGGGGGFFTFVPEPGSAAALAIVGLVAGRRRAVSINA